MTETQDNEIILLDYYKKKARQLGMTEEDYKRAYFQTLTERGAYINKYLEKLKKKKAENDTAVGGGITIEFTLTFILFVSLILPFTTFVHELGHAIVAITLLKVPVEVKLGTRFKGNGFTIGRLNIKIQPLSGWVGFFSYKVPSETNNRVKSIAVFLSGPISSLMLFGTSSLLISYFDFPTIIHFLMKAIMNAALAQFVITIIPMRYPSFFGAYSGITSDGYKVMKLLQRG